MFLHIDISVSGCAVGHKSVLSVLEQTGPKNIIWSSFSAAWGSFRCTFLRSVYKVKLEHRGLRRKPSSPHPHPRPPPPNWIQSSSFNEPCVHLFAHSPLNLCTVTAAWIQPAGEAEAEAMNQTREGRVKKKLCTTKHHDDLHESLDVSVVYMRFTWTCLYVFVFKCVCVCGAAGGCWDVSLLYIHMIACPCSSRSTWLPPVVSELLLQRGRSLWATCSHITQGFVLSSESSTGTLWRS